MVQPSTRPISSSEKSQILQKTVLIIIHTSSREKPQWTPPIVNSVEEIATVRATQPTEMERRLLREWKYRSSRFSSSPIKTPRPRERTISTRGSTNTDTTLTVPLVSAEATPNDTANSTRPTASSIATTNSSSRVRGPSALYCRTTISVAAGAVAAAMAPRVRAAAAEIS